ncbi:Modification methylase HphIA [Colletotrichum sp. SAR11_239]|nr:Modification methylase HphIA [Colletotrichum sp. SAR11_239]
MNGRRAGESPDNAIDVDENDLVFEVDREVVEIARRVRNYQPRKNRSLASQASDGVDEEKDENLASEALAGLIDLTIDDEPIVVRRSRKRRPKPQREIPQREHERFQYKKLMIKVNTLYELDPEQTPPTAVGVHFIKVTTILENLESGEIKICGLPFCRSRTLMAKLPRKLNEIFCLLEIDADDDRPAEIQARIEVSAATLIRPRALHLTNAPYPKHRSLVERLRPRIFTLEQTFGILQGCHDPFFCSLVGGFTDYGYSVTWKIVHLQTWGLPQTRKRLIMIGACPGEKLPPFPTATHSETGLGGLSKYVTIRQALRKITDDSTFHNPDEEITDSPPPSGSVVSDPDQILKRCVTCSGGQNRHYSNTRAYTVREFASLQGFPVWHKFSPASKAVLKKQIGNAFPACVVKLLCEHLKDWLLEVDGLAASRPGRASVGGRELIFVSEGPRQPSPLELVQPLLLPMDVGIGGGSLDQAIMLDEDEQCEIKFDIDSDIEMEDVPVPDVPDSPRSATLSLPGTPEPPQVGCVRDLPIFID